MHTALPSVCHTLSVSTRTLLINLRILSLNYFNFILVEGSGQGWATHMDSPLNTDGGAEFCGHRQVHQDILAVQPSSAQGPFHVHRTGIYIQAGNGWEVIGVPGLGADTDWRQRTGLAGGTIL